MAPGGGLPGALDEGSNPGIVPLADEPPRSAGRASRPWMRRWRRC